MNQNLINYTMTLSVILLTVLIDFMNFLLLDICTLLNFMTSFLLIMTMPMAIIVDSLNYWFITYPWDFMT